MAKINILDSSIYNRIAAGEVVERPASVVKEFVENSIDAGSKNIIVRIERGGKDLISVADDGCGIEKSELRSAFLPHATSKIAKVEDLDDIATLGFRGEALASVASVANVTIKSRAQQSDESFSLTCSGGKMGEILPCALESGTEIDAENLFFNTPVRAKFMKTDKGEESEISTVIARFILGNPNITFKYYIDGKLSVQSFGGGLAEAIAAVYGASVIADCYQIDAVKHGIHIRGYIGKPSFTKANRTYQNCFVNGRFVVNNTISSAVTNAYASYLMKRQYPFYVLFIDIPHEAVDVNVHPNKSDVRFENNQVIYGCVYSVISGVLDGNAAALDFVVKDGNSKEEIKNSVSENKAARNIQNIVQKKSEETPIQQKQIENFDTQSTKSAAVKKESLLEQYKKDDDRIILAGYGKIPKLKGGITIEFHDSGAPDDAQGADHEKAKQVSSDTLSSTKRIVRDDNGVPFADSILPFVNKQNEDKKDDVFFENKKYIEALEKKASQEKFIFENAVYKGNLFNTYLLYEEGDNVYIIDQHAAHERLIFDRLCEEMRSRKVVQQPMLVPFVLSLNREEANFIGDNVKNIEEIGFEIEEFGEGSFKISSVPMDLQDIDLKAFFDDLLGEIGNLKGIKLSELLRDKIAMTACKHAVKGGMMLSDTEKSKLFEMLHGDMGLKCPHGRPVAVKLTRYEVEKMFKRIV